MAWIDSLRSLFRRSALPTQEQLNNVDAALQQPIPTGPAPITTIGASLSSPFGTETDSSSQFSSADEVPAWLEDEDLLRDEGVIFGLTEARPEEKISVIRNYFTHRTANLERDRERFNEKIGELNLFIEQKETRIGELQQRRNEIEAYQPGDHHLPRTLIGLVLSIAMCAGNYFLIEETLRPAFEQSRLISIGVFLAGMFSLFNRTSLFHDTTTPATGRRLLEEVGLPLAAALFVFAQALQTQTLVRALALLVFIFFLFLLAGKLMLGTLTVLRNDLRTYNRNRQMQRQQQTKLTDWEAEVDKLRQEINELRVQKWQIIPNLNRTEAELSRLHAKRDLLIKLFESEYNLASTLRDQLTDRQRQAILRGR